MQKILNLIGKDSLIGFLAISAQKLNISFEIVGSESGRAYIDSLYDIFEFAQTVRPEVTYCIRSGQEARVDTFDSPIKLDLIISEIARGQEPICIFNHISGRRWTYVFVLHHPEDLPNLFKQAQPNDYFMSDAQGNFMLAANWHDFSYAK